MNRNARIFCFLVLGLTVLGGCSSGPAAKEARKARNLDKIQGKAQVLTESGGATDAALNAGGPTVYLWEGERRYRLFLKTAVEIVHGSEYVAEGIDAQKAIDEIGDPDQGKNGYPLEASCATVVGMAWNGLAFDAADADASLLRATVKRYPARHVFLVAKIRPATAAEIAAMKDADKDSAADSENVAEIAVAPEKQSASLLEGPVVQTAPLWEPGGGVVKCKVVINAAGKISDLATGAQLCEAVPWSQFRYKPTLQNGKPVRVTTEVEIRFDARE